MIAALLTDAHMRWLELGLPVVAGLALGLASIAQADVVKWPEQTSGHAQAPLQLPRRGQSMAEVLRAFGPPLKKHPTVGGHTPLHPPITRWDYPGFSVFFERHTVIDSVVPGRPPKLYHAHQLRIGS
ncbi:MAG TPA: hypothetical protein VFQ88_08025 [Nevskiaceae bacterium]|nr:hypothetical protein [Nevskiaceae bacterium]